ncbi:hypothetical protein BDY17DRAFT_29835 [Neohortaea acidophila]|uniref:Uncharacterized protein n=1 Tax=Neohortaea acidophila TaxID=245834 RepID=A0A6A6PIW6_9PEZI|nr:uncharacterized protein BDY17DRAFT_29835 [Neohortaea acidophila]KAF2479988.1 hypothetical protein BDY17DRAFT_29835 [Neohortaea acidophila]
MASSPSRTSDDDFPIEELVFSCTVCQATISEVYATTESNKGFHSGSGDEDGIVTKLWIAECSHITCAKHLEDGAPPFHPKDLPPKAPCPKCVKDKGDDSPKDLYGIRGLGDGEYDAMIPAEWRRCPAIKLDSSVPGMSAVRFQYMALCQYARQARKHWKGSASKLSKAEAACSEERRQRRELQSQVQQLKKQTETVQDLESRLKKWEARKPVINREPL